MGLDRGILRVAYHILTKKDYGEGELTYLRAKASKPVRMSPGKNSCRKIQSEKNRSEVEI